MAVLPVQIHSKVGLGQLLAVGHHLLFDDEGGPGAQGGLRGADGGVHALDLGGLHLQIAVLIHLHHGGGVHDVLPHTVALAIVALHIAHPGALAHMEGVDPGVLRILHPAVVDAAAGHNGHITVVADDEIVVDGLIQAALAEHHGDMDRLIFGAGLNDDVDAVLVLFADNVDVGGGVPGGRLPVGPDVIGPFGHIMELGDLLQQILLYRVHASVSFCLLEMRRSEFGMTASGSAGGIGSLRPKPARQCLISNS